MASTHDYTADVVVVGGGPAGLGSAIAASRNGAKTILVERYGFTGGMATAGMLLVLCGFNDRKRRVIAGIPQELVDRMSAMGGAIDRQFTDRWYPAVTFVPFDIEAFKYSADQMLKQSGVKCLFHSYFVDVLRDNGGLRGVVVENKSGRQSIASDVVVDATGDGDVACRAGATCEIGSAEGGKLSGLSMMFRLGNVRTRLFEEHYLAMDEAKRNGSLPPALRSFCVSKLPRPGEVIVNTTTLFGDGTDVEDLSRMEMEGREHVMQMCNHMRKYLPGFGDCHLIASASQVGVRETRRVVGAYTLTKDDVLSSASFPDGIAKGAWNIDIHPSSADERHLAEHSAAGLAYDIPYRCLLPSGQPGLIVAGRCISASREAFGSLRVMATCMAIGQAAGTAAAMAVRAKATPGEVDVEALRNTLRVQGAIVD